MLWVLTIVWIHFVCGEFLRIIFWLWGINIFDPTRKKQLELRRYELGQSPRRVPNKLRKRPHTRHGDGWVYKLISVLRVLFWDHPFYKRFILGNFQVFFKRGFLQYMWAWQRKIKNPEKATKTVQNPQVSLEHRGRVLCSATSQNRMVVAYCNCICAHQTMTCAIVYTCNIHWTSWFRTNPP